MLWLWAAGAAAASSTMPPIRHVFVIVLENESAKTTFGAGSPAPYLSKTLRSRGAYLPKYYGTGHESNDNYISMISGQAPNAENQADCQNFDDLSPGTIGSYGQAVGEGCVYPSSVQTIANQLTTAGLTWRDYDEDMGADPSREPAECAHPGVGQTDGTQKATATDQYATRHNPFVYFHSIIDDTAYCDEHVVNLNLLSHDLSSSNTPNYVFITPDLCDDGHDSPCANGDRGGLAQANGFLRTWVPRIERSPSFQNGLLIITFDESATSDTSSCCGEIPGPGSPSPGVTGKGGGDTGAVLLSPCIAPGTVTEQPYNHYTMLRSIEDLFGVGHLGYAQLPGERSFGSDIFTRACGLSLRTPALASQVSRRPSFRVRWSDPGLSRKLARFTVRVRTVGVRSRWRVLVRRAKRHSLRFRGRLGKTYEFQVKIAGGHGLSGWISGTTVVPSGVHARGGRYHGPWHVRVLRGAWEKRTISCAKQSCSFSLSYRGGSIAVIGERGPRGGTASISLDGHSVTVNLHASRVKHRAVLFRAATGSGKHRLRIKVLSGVVSLEGFGVG